jgi:hypothetical protein
MACWKNLSIQVLQAEGLGVILIFIVFHNTLYNDRDLGPINNNLNICNPIDLATVME